MRRPEQGLCSWWGRGGSPGAGLGEADTVCRGEDASVAAAGGDVVGFVEGRGRRRRRRRGTRRGSRRLRGRREGCNG